MGFLSIFESDGAEESRSTDEMPCPRCEVESLESDSIDDMFHYDNEKLDREFT